MVRANTIERPSSGESRQFEGVPIDLVESGGGMWKISSLPAINYCLTAGARLRRLAGVSGGGLITGLLAAGATPMEMLTMLPKIQDINFLDAFQIPTKLREIYGSRLLVENTAGRLPKQRDLRLSELPVELSIVCARLDVPNSIAGVLRRTGQHLKGKNFASLLRATVEFTRLLRSMRVQETMQHAVANAQLVELSSRLTPDVSVIDAMAASCAFFIGYQIDGEELHDGFYFSNLPTRVIVKRKPRAYVLANQTNPFVGDSWTNWFLRLVFNNDTIEILQERFAEDEELAEEYGVLLAPRVQEITSPFSAALCPELVKAGRDALAANRFQIDQMLTRRSRKQAVR